MTDLWDKKPKRRTYQYYGVEEMDAWLGKVKDHIEGLEETIRNGTDSELRLHNLIDELQPKAEKWDRLDQPAKYNLTKYMECSDRLEAVKNELNTYRDEFHEYDKKYLINSLNLIRAAVEGETSV